MTDRSVMARALMYLLAAVGTAIVASVAIPNAPLHDEHAVPVLAGIAYAAAIGVFFGFERLPAWGIHAILLGDAATTPALHWALTASALLLLCVAIQGLTSRLARLVERLTDIGRADS